MRSTAMLLLASSLRSELNGRRLAPSAALAARWFLDILSGSERASRLVIKRIGRFNIEMAEYKQRAVMIWRLAVHA